MIDPRVLVGDCRARMAELPPSSVHAVVTDPPYNLGFMGRTWDRFGRAEFQRWCEEWAAEALRVLRPGGHLVAFGGTRTWHRLTCGLEDAGFDVRDTLCWLYGSGFPKSLDVGKAIDRAAGAEREVLGSYSTNVGMQGGRLVGGGERGEVYVTAPATADASEWDGWGTALKPAWEPIVLARKPLAAGTVAANVLEHGAGAMNVAGCRLPLSADDAAAYLAGIEAWARCRREGTTGEPGQGRSLNSAVHGDSRTGHEELAVPEGRWPANVVLGHGDACVLYEDGWACPPECAAAILDEQTGVLAAGGYPARRGADHSRQVFGGFSGHEVGPARSMAAGGASRFFYAAKAGADERPEVNGLQHPTVKPLSLVRWLVRLVTPPAGVVLDPFLGSGTTAEAALLEEVGWLGCEKDPDYLPLIQARINRFGVGASPGVALPRKRPVEVAEGQGALF